MRLPNGYGSVIDLGKKRRKRYAVRVSDGLRKNKNDQMVQKYKYLDYFVTSKEAYGYLAKRNSGEPIKEHVSLINQPTFTEVFDEWYKYKHNLNKKPSGASSRAYRYGFNMCESLHKKKFKNLKTDDLQDVVDKYKTMSKGTVNNVKTILFALYEYALKREIVEKDYSKLIDFEWSEEKRIEHCSFTEKEIEFLWNHLDVEYVDWALIMIYTSLRASEFCDLRTINIHLEERYLIGGNKTEAGKNRVIPLHERIVPLIQKLYNKDNEFLVYNINDEPMIYKTFLLYWTDLMTTLRLEHLPHDTRYTTATLLDRYEANKVCIKKIMGHATQDITDGIYIQKNLSDLTSAIDLIPNKFV